MKLRNIIIIVLSVIVLAFSALFLISLNRLTDLKAEVASLSDQVQEIADEASSLASQSAADNSQTTAQADTDTASNQTAQADDASLETEDSDKKTAEIAPPSGSSQLEQEEAAPITDDLSNLQSQLEQIIGTFSDGTWSVSVTNLITGATCQINNGQMQAASLIKLYIMGAVYENYSEITSANDSNTVDSLLRSMITVSDNEAANQLVSMLGGGDSGAGMAVVNTYCQEHGFNETHMGRLLLASNESDDNYTSAADCARFLQAVYQGDPSFSNTDSMYALLKAQERVNKIPQGIPTADGAKVANKTGELDTVENDAGIVYECPRTDFIVSVMSENLSDVSTAQGNIATIARLVYGYFNE